jgi:hypothetical protein
MNSLLAYDKPLQNRLQLYNYNWGTDTAYYCTHHTSSRVHPNGSERFRSIDFFPNYFELFRTICFLCLAYLRTVPNGSAVAYVIEAPLLGWDRFRLDWFKQGCCFCGLSKDRYILQACSITHVMCTLSIVCFAIK